MKLAERLQRLGTETAFAISGEATAFAAKGNKVYPFHLGDINLITPQNIIEAALKAARDGKTGYCPNAGIPELREAVAEDVGRARGISYGTDNVSIQPGGKPTIGKVILAMMNPGDRVLYPNPGYPIYESLIEFNGGVAVPYTFKEGDSNFVMDLEGIERALENGPVRLFVYNDLQNPTAAESTSKEMERLAELAIKHDMYVLSDEAYFDIRFEGRSRSIASLPGMFDRTVILYTFSKKYAMTGWRLGASIGPKEIIDAVNRVNVNQESCTNHFVQWAGIEALQGDQTGAAVILETLRQRRDRAVDWIQSMPGVHCFKPHASFYLFPNVTEAMRVKGMNYEEFRRGALHATGVSFCTRGHFGRVLAGETQKYMRFAYSGIDLDEIEEGLNRLKVWVES